MKWFAITAVVCILACSAKTSTVQESGRTEDAQPVAAACPECRACPMPVPYVPTCPEVICPACSESASNPPLGLPDAICMMVGAGFQQEEMLGYQAVVHVHRQGGWYKVIDDTVDGPRARAVSREEYPIGDAAIAHLRANPDNVGRVVVFENEWQQRGNNLSLLRHAPFEGTPGAKMLMSTSCTLLQ